MPLFQKNLKKWRKKEKWKNEIRTKVVYNQLNNQFRIYLLPSQEYMKASLNYLVFHFSTQKNEIGDTRIFYLVFQMSFVRSRFSFFQSRFSMQKSPLRERSSVVFVDTFGKKQILRLIFLKNEIGKTRNEIRKTRFEKRDRKILVSPISFFYVEKRKTR